MTTDERINKQVVRLVLDHPFFASLVMRMPITERAGIPTFCTDGRHIYYNKEYADSLDDQTIRGVLCHEVLHPALGHLWRFKGKDMDIANQACDHAINLFIEEYNSKAPASLKLTLPDGGCCDPEYAGLSAEEIYSILMHEKQQEEEQGKQPDKKPSAGEFTEPGDGEPGDGDEQGEGEAPPFGTEEKDWQIALEQAAQVAKIQGRMPGGAEALIKARHKPSVPWVDVLRRFVGKASNNDFSMEIPDKRFAEDDLFVETLYDESVGDVVFAVDTSGSIPNGLLEKFSSEAEDVLATVRPNKLWFVQCDSKIHECTAYSPGDKVTSTLKGRGGTNFRPVFDLIKTKQLQPECVVYLTDGMGSFPDKQPCYPVLWLDYGGTKYPWGEVVRVAA